ncbi:MAG: hypothetical protein ACLUGJ_15925 [Blautia wexlerae]
MRTKKFLAMAIALGLAVGATAMPTLAAEKRHLYLVIPPLMRKMKRQILIHKIHMQDGRVSVME